MTSTQFHILLNHLPVFGSLLGFLVLAHGMATKSKQTNMIGYCILILTSGGTILAYITGNMSQEIKNISDVSPILIANHKTFALLTLMSLMALVFVAFIALLLIHFKTPLSNKLSLLTLFIAAISFVLVARTTNLGIKIKHSGITNTSGLSFPDLAITKINNKN